MAEGNKGPKQDELVSKLVKDAQAPPDVLLLSGFIGASSEEGHTRLYFDPQLSDYVEIPNDAILHTQEVAKDQSPLGGTLIWIKKDAVLIHGKVGPNRPKAKFLEGRIQQEFLKGNAAAAQPIPQIGGNPQTQLGIGCPTNSPLICTVNGEACPTTDGACTVVGLNCPTQQVVCTSFGPGCQIFTAPPTATSPCTHVPLCPPPPTHHFGCTIFGACAPTHSCPVRTAFCPQTVPAVGCHITLSAACQILTVHCPALTAVCPVQTAAGCRPVSLGCPVGGIGGPVAAAHAAVPQALTLPQPCGIHTEACPPTAVLCNTVSPLQCHPSLAAPCVTQTQPACHASVLIPCVTHQLPACGPSVATPCVTINQPVCHPSVATPCLTQNQPICHPSVLTPCVTQNQPICHPSVATPCVTHNEPTCRPSVLTPCVTQNQPICHPSVLTPCITQNVLSCQITLPAHCPVATGAGCPVVSLGCPEGGGPVAGGGVAQAAVAGMNIGVAPALHVTLVNACGPVHTVLVCPPHLTIAGHVCPLPTLPPHCPFPTQFCPSAFCPSGFCPSLACGQGGFGGGGIGPM